MTLLAGDIGATTRLAIISPGAGPRMFVAERGFRSADYKGLQPIVEEFLGKNRERPTAACFDVAGPVIAGRAHLTNLPWDLEEAALCRDMGLDRITLLDDLEAVAHAVPYLQPEKSVAINEGRAVDRTSIAVLAPCTGLGEAFLVWAGERYVTAPPKAVTRISLRRTRCRGTVGVPDRALPPRGLRAGLRRLRRRTARRPPSTRHCRIPAAIPSPPRRCAS